MTISVLMLLATQSIAENVSRFNQNPLITIYGLPNHLNSKVITESSSKLISSFNWSNIYYLSPITNQTEYLLIDSESVQLNIQYILSISNKWELGIDLGMRSNSAGSLDTFINNWHDTFNFTDHGRDNSTVNNYEIVFQQGNETLLDITQSASGITDTSLFMGYQIFNEDMYPYNAMAFRLNINLPTGDSDQLLGSGSKDISAWIDFSQNNRVYNFEIKIQLSAGLLYIHNGDVLSQYVNDLVGFSKLKMSVPFTNNWLFNAFTNVHTPFYGSTEIRALNDYGIDVGVGFTHHLSKTISQSFGLVEDINVGVSADIVFYYGLSFNL